MKKKRKKKIIKYILIVLIPIILSVGGFYVYKTFFETTRMPNSVKKLIKEKEKINYSDKDDKKPEVSNYVNPIPQLRDAYGNTDIMGRLEIPGLNIDTPIPRASDNGWYLNYNLYGQWDELGVPFFDYRNTDLANDKQINIYGHNTQNMSVADKLPFVNLEAYTDYNMFINYNDVYLSLDEKQIHYEVVAVKILTDGNPEHTKIKFTSNTDYLSHISKMLANSLYMTDNANFTANDNILVLQVCHYQPMNSYLLVFCKEKK